MRGWRTDKSSRLNRLVEALDPDLRTWAYMDDRTVAVLRQGSRRLLNVALQTTQRFDAALGFEVNPDKTQLWSHDHGFKSGPSP